MLEKLLAKLQAFLDGHFVPKADLDAANSKLAELTERNGQLEAQLAQSNDGRTKESELLTAANQQVSALTTERDELKAENEKLKSEAKTLDEAAAAKAREICAAQGIPEKKLDSSTDAPVQSAEKELESLRGKLATETDPKKRASMAARCRELRGHGNLFKTN